MASTAAIGSNRRKTFMAILIPVLVLFCAFNTIPLITGFLYSFTDSKGYGAFNIVGIPELHRHVQRYPYPELVSVHVQGAIVATLGTNVISLMLAIGLTSKIKFKSALRGVYFVPRILGGLVVGYVFSYFFTYIVPAITGTESILANPTGRGWPS